jgi:LuxR family maltose regulon positive regulatory protein
VRCQVTPEGTAKPARSEAQTDWLAQTKLRAPRLREDLIPRQRLLRALYDALTSYPLTLLSAPAGYGKTTLLAELSSAFPELRLAWLSLDEDDNDPARFLVALIAAVQQSNPACGAIAQTLLVSLTNPAAEVRRVIDALINNVLECQLEAYLILDDLHLITEPAIYALLNYLLERLPSSMHLAVTARRDPPLSLARLRARGQLYEIRLPDLRFTFDEAASFLNEKLCLDLSHDDLSALQSRAEGWVAGLRLLAGSLDRMETSADRSAFIRHLAHTDRYVFDFLAEEVLKRQEPKIRTFLLETSILPELTPALCQAVTGRSDAGRFLEDLYRRNLFLVEVPMPQPEPGDTGVAFRYHALFAEFLRGQLATEMPGRSVELNRRAAHALAPTAPARAIAHFLIAELWEDAAQMIEGIGALALRQGLLESLSSWISSLPEGIRDARPRLSYFLGVCELHKSDLAASVFHLQQALSGLELAQDEAGQGDVLAYLARAAFLEADFQRGHALIGRALDYPLPPHRRVHLLVERARLAQFQGDHLQTKADLEEAFQVYQESGDLDSLEALLAGFLPGFAALPGFLERFERIGREASARLGSVVVPMQMALNAQWAFVHFYRGRLDEASQAGESALALGERFGGLPLWSYWATTLVVIGVKVARREPVVLNPLVESLLRQNDLSTTVIGGLLYLLAHACWLENRHQDMHRIYHHMRQAEKTLMSPLLLAMAQGILEMADRHYAAAVRPLREAVDLEGRVHIFNLFGSARVLLASAYLEWGHPDDALGELTQALSECEHQGASGRILMEGRAVIPLLRLAVKRGIHVEIATQLLSTLRADTGQEAPRPVPVPGTGETLTSREVEVLRLIAAGASNRGIAEQLVISERTVKTHITHILGKLGVSSRTQAAALARELRLI